MHDIDPAQQRRFALEVLLRLREAGYHALWAGGCVRDELLGLRPKDYDVATNATPEQVRQLFGPRRTLEIGAAFGVVAVLGPKAAGPVEVTTFRRDEKYSDGRHPDAVTFSSPREDALRRDFTINGLFFDPVEHRVIDYVGGQADLEARLLRAIGNPVERLSEDKLRMLRAVRIAAVFELEIEAGTMAAIQSMAGEILTVSHERIAQEMQKMLTSARRVRGARLLVESRLAQPVLPEVLPLVECKRTAPPRLSWWDFTLDVLGRLVEPSFPLALAGLIHGVVEAGLVSATGGGKGHRKRSPAVLLVTEIARRWRLSNDAAERCGWLIDNLHGLDNAAGQAWSRLQPLLIQPGIEELIALGEAIALAEGREVADAAFCREKLALPAEVLNPPPLVSGHDLIARGLPRGVIYARLLAQVRQAQLDGLVGTTAEALQLVDRLLAEPKGETG